MVRPSKRKFVNRKLIPVRPIHQQKILVPVIPMTTVGLLVPMNQWKLLMKFNTMKNVGRNIQEKKSDGYPRLLSMATLSREIRRARGLKSFVRNELCICVSMLVTEFVSDTTEMLVTSKSLNIS